MLWAMGAILLTFQAVPQAALPATASSPVASTASVEAVQSAQPAEKLTLADASVSDEIGPFQPGRLALTPATPAAPAPAAAAASPAPFSPAIAPAIAPRKTALAGRINDGQKKMWLGLAIAQHSAATFDAWSTRRAITQNGAQELNPMLKPFAKNSSIYAATQVGPALLDLLGHRMMTSRHPLLRHTWWLPQVLGTAASVAGATHNLGVR
jgi:hypothetical protein